MSFFVHKRPSAEVVVARRRRARGALRGDSLIEVMAALAIASIGIVGITSMQSTVVRSNQDAQDTTVAISFARTWLERIKRDALLWQAPVVPTTLHGNVVLGRSVSGSGDQYFLAGGGWGVPVPLYNQESAGANSRGIDVGAPDFALPGSPIVTNEQIHYCVNTRFSTTELAANGFPAKMTAAVRVWWTRRASLNETDYTGPMLQVRANGCGAVIPDDTQLRSRHLRVLYLSTPLRFNPPTI
jgi:type II secretory pathway pseudopilin PulG